MSAAHGTPQLVEVADGVHAYLQLGGWGYNNAGLVASGDGSLLIDTLFDLPLTRQMLDVMRRAVPQATHIGTVVNTHANGDHCWGNQLVDGADIVSSRRSAEEMQELKPGRMQALVRAAAWMASLNPTARRALGALGRLGLPHVGPLSEAAEFVGACFGGFDFRGIQLTPPTTTFDDRLDLQVGAQAVELLEVGPAHTKGDVVVHLPQSRVAFTGDILFIGSHPIIWEGPVRNWIAACDRLLALDVDVIVPGHGPLTDKQGVQDTKDYWQYIVAAAEQGHASGASPDEVAQQLISERYAHWSEAHRLVVNLDTVYRELDGDTSTREPVGMFARMSRLGV